MASDTVLLEQAAHVAILTLNRPEALNAWNDHMVAECLKAIRRLEDDPETRVVVLTGAGRAFSSGADIREWFHEMVRGEKPFMETVTGLTLSGAPSVFDVVRKIQSLGKPVIAAVNGVAAGIGLNMALACDIRLAADNARFVIGYTALGLIPDGGATSFLPRLMGMGRACKFVFSGDPMDAREAERVGMVDEVVPAQELLGRAKQLGHRIAAMAPLALRMAKLAMQRGWNEPSLSSQIDFEAYAQQALFETEDFREGVKAFLEKRKAEFKGR